MGEPLAPKIEKYRGALEFACPNRSTAALSGRGMHAPCINPRGSRCTSEAQSRRRLESACNSFRNVNKKRDDKGDEVRGPGTWVTARDLSAMRQLDNEDPGLCMLEGAVVRGD